MKQREKYFAAWFPPLFTARRFLHQVSQGDDVKTVAARINRRLDAKLVLPAFLSLLEEKLPELAKELQAADAAKRTNSELLATPKTLPSRKKAQLYP